LALPSVDLVHDLNQFPYPFESNEIDEIWMDQVLEHLENPLKVMEEIHRICKRGAKVTIGVPYFRSSYAIIDPTHRNFFGVQWFSYFDPSHQFHEKYRYSHAKFGIQRIEFDREFKKVRPNFIHRTMIRIAEKWPISYEMRLSHLYPLNSLTFFLTVIK
jgi:predicted SAM-dependent methyltransferase